jgi:hypothetical protein
MDGSPKFNFSPFVPFNLHDMQTDPQSSLIRKFRIFCKGAFANENVSNIPVTIISVTTQLAEDPVYQLVGVRHPRCNS